MNVALKISQRKIRWHGRNRNSHIVTQNSISGEEGIRQDAWEVTTAPEFFQMGSEEEKQDLGGSTKVVGFDQWRVG